MTELTQVLKLLRTVFNKYSKSGKKDTLTKSEVSHLLCTELKLPSQRKPEVEKYVQEMDIDGDGVVTFKEFVTYLVDVELMLFKE